MSEREDHREPLFTEDSETLEMMVKIMEGAVRQRPTTVDSSRLILFALGQTDTPEEIAWLNALMDSFELRSELLFLDKLLERQSLAELSKDPRYGPAVSEILSNALLALKPNATDIPKLIWQAIGDDWKQIFATPRYAFSRDSSPHLPYRVAVKNGGLVIEIEKDDKRLRRQCSIFLKDRRGSTFNLWQGEIDSPAMQIELEGIASQLGFNEGPVPGEILEFAFEDVISEPTGTIRLQISDSSEVEVPLVKPIQISQGELIIEVDVSEVKRNRTWKVALVVSVGSASLSLETVELAQDSQKLTMKANVPQTESFEFGGTSLFFLKVLS